MCNAEKNLYLSMSARKPDFTRSLFGMKDFASVETLRVSVLADGRRTA